LSARRFTVVAGVLAAAILSACFLAGALLSPFATSETLARKPAVKWQPRVFTADGKSAERPFGQVLASLANTEPWRRSARDLSAGEIADLLGNASAAAIVPNGQKGLLAITAHRRPQICAEYLPPNNSWSLVFCS
jgi:hypothetical protein